MLLYVHCSHLWRLVNTIFVFSVFKTHLSA
ncbi:hypothetical protein [Enterobacter phage vB_EclS_AS5]